MICSMFNVQHLIFQIIFRYIFTFVCFCRSCFCLQPFFLRALGASEVFNDLAQKRPANLSWIYSRLEGPVFVYRLFMTISYDVGDIMLYLPLSGCLNYVNPPIGLRVQPLSTMNPAIQPPSFSGGWKSFAAATSQAV